MENMNLLEILTEISGADCGNSTKVEDTHLQLIHIGATQRKICLSLSTCSI